MTIVARHTFGLVLGQVPEGEVPLFGMAGEAFRRLGFGIGQPLAEDKDPNSSLAALLHVSRTRAVTGLTTLLVGRAPGNAFFRVGGHHICLVPVLVASFTDFRSHCTIARFYLRKG